MLNDVLCVAMNFSVLYNYFLWETIGASYSEGDIKKNIWL